MTRLRPWLELVFGPLVAFSLCVHDVFRPPACWWEDTLAEYEQNPPWRED